MGHAHDIEIRNSELYLIEGGGFAYDIFDDGYNADGEMCNDVKLCCQSAIMGHFETEHMGMVMRGVSAP
jgi:hypothetical protein